ncbi:MAG: hypothetical protein GF383_05475 [Candidatus Lokiarchaeota archaeon]|nr:hypothetical protein [Candidatus Lokiarchaeota archaeon]
MGKLNEVKGMIEFYLKRKSIILESFVKYTQEASEKGWPLTVKIEDINKLYVELEQVYQSNDLKATFEKIQEIIIYNDTMHVERVEHLRQIFRGRLRMPYQSGRRPTQVYDCLGGKTGGTRK